MTKIIRDLHQAHIERDTVLTIGAFDGLHLGHQELLQALMHTARQTDRISGVVTFDPLPRAVLQPDRNAVFLTTLEDKIELLTEWGVGLMAVLPFSVELARTSARDFVQMLGQSLRMTELWIGWDFALGRGRTGDARTLSRLGELMGFHVHVIDPVSDGFTVISSTQIRQLIAVGRVQEAAQMLGRYHQVPAVVITGRGRGRLLGFPTANLQISEHCAVPEGGVYAVYVLHEGKRHPAVANIGFRPTFGGDERSVEVHVLDFDGDLYDQQIRLQFVEHLRPERRFSSPKGLVAQIARDTARARAVLA